MFFTVHRTTHVQHIYQRSRYSTWWPSFCSSRCWHQRPQPCGSEGLAHREVIVGQPIVKRHRCFMLETCGNHWFFHKEKMKNGDWTNINMVSWEYQINESASRHVFSLIVFPPQIETWPRMLLQRSELIQVLTHGVPRAVLSGAWCGAWCGAVTWGSHGKNHPKKWWGSIFNKDVYRLSYLYTHT
jgi:hypothetical protein